MAQYNLNLPGMEVDEIILNRHGDKVKIPSGDAAFLKRFTDGYRKIIEISQNIPKDMEKVGDIDEEKDDVIAISKKVDGLATVNLNFSNQACEVIDGVFGEGTAKMSFRDWYEEKPDFAPGLSLIMRFFNTMVPIVKRIFDKEAEEIGSASLQSAENLQSMEKYKPQDYKRLGK